MNNIIYIYIKKQENIFFMNKIYKIFINIIYKYVENNNNRKYTDIRPNLSEKTN